MFNKLRLKQANPSVPPRDYDNGPENPVSTAFQKHPDKSKRSLPSIIGAGVEVLGNITANSDFQVDGVIDGQVVTGRLLISESGVVSGEIITEVLEIWGRVNGRIKAKYVYIRDGAEVLADILYGEIEISRDARLEGSLTVMQESREKRRVRSPRTYDLLGQQD